MLVKESIKTHGVWTYNAVQIIQINAKKPTEIRQGQKDLVSTFA